MTPKRKHSDVTAGAQGTGVRRKGGNTADTILTKSELQEMLASAHAQQLALQIEQERTAALAQETERALQLAIEEEKRGRSTAPKKSPKRIYADGLDEFEMAMAKHGISLDDLLKAARSLELGTSTPYARLAHAVISWWCSKPMGSRRVVWVDPASGFTERTVPKFSTAEGQDLLTRGLAGAAWVSTRKHLLDARAWAKRMLQLTAAERLATPIQLGDERLTRR